MNMTVSSAFLMRTKKNAQIYAFLQIHSYRKNFKFKCPTPYVYIYIRT